MKYSLTFLMFCIFTFVKAQQLQNKIYNSSCIQVDSSNSISSDFYNLSFKLPHGWSGEFSGENPSLSIKKQTDSAAFLIKAYRTYDSTGDIFSYYLSEFDHKNFEIFNVNNKKLLIEYKPKSNSYSIRFHRNIKKNLWLWTVEIYGANGKENLINCDFSKIVNEFITKLHID